MNQQSYRRVVIVKIPLSLTISWCPFIQEYANASDLGTEKSTMDPIIEWNKTYGAIYDEEDWMVRQIADQEYILAGYTGSYGYATADIWLVKTNANRAKERSKTFGGSGNDLNRAIQQTLTILFRWIYD